MSKSEPAPRALWPLAAGLGLVAALVCAAGGEPRTLESLMADLAQVERVEAAYTETVESSLLATRLTSTGRLIYTAPDRIVKTGATGEEVEIAGERIRVQRGEAVEEFAVRDYAPLERLVEALRATFAGGLARLRRDYALDFTATSAGWTLVLSPREITLAAAFERMEITGHRDAIDRIAITEAGGDRRTMTLSAESIRRRAATP